MIFNMRIRLQNQQDIMCSKNLQAFYEIYKNEQKIEALNVPIKYKEILIKL